MTGACVTKWGGGANFINKFQLPADAEDKFLQYRISKFGKLTLLPNRWNDQ